jgi:hypothetical protein
MKRFTRFALLLPFAVILAVGCGGQAKTKVPYTLARKSGTPALTMGKVTIVFEGLPMEGNDATLSSSYFYVPHPGSPVTPGEGASVVNELKIREVPSNDDNTVMLNNTYSFKIIDKGRRIRIGDKTLTIDKGPPKNVVVNKAGIVRVD